MFEQALEKATAAIWIDQREADACFSHGVPLWSGSKRVDYSEAASLVADLNKALVGIKIKYEKRRIETARNSICFAFGPEFEALHRAVQP